MRIGGYPLLHEAFFLAQNLEAEWLVENTDHLSLTVRSMLALVSTVIQTHPSLSVPLKYHLLSLHLALISHHLFAFLCPLSHHNSTYPLALLMYF